MAARCTPTYSAVLVFSTRVMNDSTLRILTLSRLRQGCEYDAFIVMARDARLRSKSLQVDGVSLFDGQRICTLVQGPASAVNAWRQEAWADPRLELVSTLVEQPFDANGSKMSCWRVGYCDVHDLDDFETDSRLRGEAALRVWQGLLARADLVG
jgi:hypothetical protein